jgi:hypothetical protein
VGSPTYQSSRALLPACIVGYFHDLIIGPENGGDMFLRNVFAFMRILGIVSRRAEFFSHHSENLTLATDNSS